MKIDDIKRISIVGSGTMGYQIGFLCAAHGYEVVLYDVKPEFLDKAKARAARLADAFADRGRLTQQEANEALSRMTYTADPAEAAKDVDLISESVPEDPKLKGKVFAQFDKLCPKRTVFTSNTSTLITSMFAEATGRPDRVAALHFHDVLLTNVVDVMPHPGTSAETVVLLKAFTEKIGQVAIVLEKESHGYVFNAMLSDWFRSAQKLAAAGVAPPEDIDRAWMGVMHTKVGPFGVMDTVGLDTVWKITQYWAKQTCDPLAQKNADFMKKYVDEGRLGVKTGQGIYTYPDPEWQRPDFLEGKKS